MYRVGLIDDENDMVNDYIRRLKRRDIELLVAPDGTKEDIKLWIVKNEIKCMLVDYKLMVKYDFKGTDLVSYLNDELQGFPCLMLTSYPGSSVEENKVVRNCIIDKSAMDSDGESFVEFCETLIQSTEVFDKNIEKYTEKYERLLKKKENNEITLEEEDELQDVFRILKAYGLVDDIPAEMLKSELSNRLDEVLSKLDNLLNE